MKKQISRLIIIVYPVISLTILPVVNYSLMNQVRHGQKIFTSINFYFILLWFIVSIIIFTYNFKNLIQLNRVSILIGLIISMFFVICVLFPMPFMTIVGKFYQIFIYNYLTTIYLALSTLSIYAVLLLFSLQEIK